MHEVLVNRLGGLSLPRKSVVRLTDRPDMTLDVYRGRKTTNQQSTIEQGRKQKVLLDIHPTCMLYVYNKQKPKNYIALGEHDPLCPGHMRTYP